MIKYRYKATDENGKYFRGEMSAENQADLEKQLRDSSLTLISCSIVKPSTFGIGEGLSNKDLITFFTHLGQLEKIGVPIIDALSDIKDSSDSSRVRNLTQGIYESVKNGNLLSESLSKHPKVFNKIFIGLISNGEKSGNLESTYHSIIEHLKWSAEIKRKTTKAIAYPSFSLLIMFIVIWVMTTVVVPRVSQFLKAQQIELPGMTVALINFSNFMQNNTLAIIIAIPIVIIFYKALHRIPKIGMAIDKFKLYLPVFGSIIIKIDVSRFCHFFSMSFKSGTGVLDCLDNAKSVIHNMAIKESIELVKQQVADGQPLSVAIYRTGYFPSLVIRMFKIGEESGNMEENLENVRFFYNQEINDSVNRIVGMIQPTLTLVMGALMAWIALSVFGPIYGTFSNL